MEQKTVAAILLGIALIILLAASFLSFRSILNYRATYRTNAFSTESEGARFRFLLHKHGLDHDISVIYDWDTDRPYFYRDGRRCAFI